MIIVFKFLILIFIASFNYNTLHVQYIFVWPFKILVRKFIKTNNSKTTNLQSTIATSNTDTLNYQVEENIIKLLLKSIII